MRNASATAAADRASPMWALYGGPSGRASKPARYTRPVTRTYVAVVVVEVLVLAALWLLSQHFAA